MGEVRCNAGLFKCEDGRLFLGFAKFGAWYWERVDESDLAYFGVPARAAENVQPGETIGIKFSGVSVVPWDVEGSESGGNQSAGLQSQYLLDGKPVISQKTLARFELKTFASRCVDSLRAFITGRR